MRGGEVRRARGAALLAGALLTLPTGAGAPVTQASQEVFARSYAAAWCSHDAARVAAFYGADAALTINSGKPARGRAAVQAAVQDFMTGYPDLIVTFERLSRAGDRVLFHWGFSGHNGGPGGTGRAVRISGYEAWRFGTDGLIADSEGRYDAADWARQVQGP